MQALQSQLRRDQAKHTGACPVQPGEGQCLYKWKISGDLEQRGIDLLGWKCPYVLPPSLKCDILNATPVHFTFWQLQRKGESEIFQTLTVKNRWKQQWKLLWFLEQLFSSLELLYQLISEAGVWPPAMMILLSFKGIFSWLQIFNTVV